MKGETMKTRMCCAVILAGALGALVGCRVEQKDARPYVVDVPVAPEVWETTAMTELTNYLSRIARSGRVMVEGQDRVVFHIGNTAFAESKGLSSAAFQDEEWAIESFGRDVVLNGGGTRGCLYAVWHFLEDFGDVHWWADNDEYVPEARPLVFGKLSARGKPHFIYRDIYRWRKADSRTAARNRLNRNGDIPIPLAYGGSFDYGPPYHCHTYNHYINFEHLGKTHPEWFSLRDGKRVGGMSKGQLCLTNPELRAEFLRLLLAQIEKSKAQAAKTGTAAPRIFAVDMNDNPSVCECPACQAEIGKFGPSGWQLNFVNFLAGEVAKRHPGILLTMLAYFHSEPVPKGGVRAADNVVVKFANTRGNLAGGVDDAGNEFLKKFVSGWKDYTKTLFVWDYATTFKDQTRGFPFPSEFHFTDRCRLYAENSVRGVLLEHEQWEIADMWELKFFVECKSFENPHADARRLVEKFCRLYYGPAADKVLSARLRLEAARQTKTGTVVTWEPTMTEFNFITKDVLAAALADFDAAEKLADGDATLLKRLKRARKGLDLLATCRKEAGEIQPAQEGVAEAPFFDFPADKKAYEPWTRSGAAFVDDPEAHGGKAVKMPLGGEGEKYDNTKSYRYPFHFGVYDTVSKKTLKARNFPKPKGEGYNWYSLGDFKFPNTGFYVYVTRAWNLKIFAGHPEISDNTFDLRLHVKFTGPFFNKGDTRENAIWVDRMIFVKR